MENNNYSSRPGKGLSSTKSSWITQIAIQKTINKVQIQKASS
jgi:hypothetical protein